MVIALVTKNRKTILSFLFVTALPFFHNLFYGGKFTIFTEDWNYQGDVLGENFTYLEQITQIIETATKNDSVVLIVKDLNFYPIVTDTLVVWPNYMEVDSLWTNFSPDVTLIFQQADYEQDSLKLYFASPTSDDFDKIWIDQDVFLNDNYAINPWTIGVATFDGLNEAGYPHDWTISLSLIHI